MKQAAYLLFLLILIAFFWDSAFLYPFKLLVVFFHESSHALATLLTGGEVRELVVEARQGGHVVSAGGNRFVILSAGYLGSLLWGIAIYVAAIKSRHDRAIAVLLGLALIGLTLALARNVFGVLFGIGAGSALLLAARVLNAEANEFLLRVVALTNMLYAPLDIYSDTIARSGLRSDARMLAEEFGGATMLWGCVWIGLSVLLIFGCLRWSVLRAESATGRT